MRARWLLGLCLLSGCGDSEIAPAPPPCEPPCGETMPDECAPGNVPLGGGACLPAGPSNEEPVLPDPCPPGELGAPGTEECQPVMDCGSGKWGAIPVEPETVYVDAAYLGGDGDGSADKPYPELALAIFGAEPDTMVAIAAGTYDEIAPLQPMRFWGVCPELVRITPSDEVAGIYLGFYTSGSEIHGVSVRGAVIGAHVNGADVLFDRLWIEGNGPEHGVLVDGYSGPASVRIERSLIENNESHGLLVIGAEATITDSVIRTSQANPFGAGRGLGLEHDPRVGPSSATVERTLIEANEEAGVFVNGSSLVLAESVVRDTVPAPDGSAGRGVVVQGSADVASELTMVSSLIENNREVGLFLAGAVATVEDSWIRATSPNGRSGFGRGIEADDLGGTPTSLTVRSSIIETSVAQGVLVAGSNATFTGVIVRGTTDRSGNAGSGITIQNSQSGSARASQLSGCLIDDNQLAGILAAGTVVSIGHTLVRDTAPDGAGSFGDGLAAIAYLGPAQLDVRHSRFEASARAGISAFGSTIALGSNEVVCAQFPLNGEPLSGEAFAFSDEGGNGCGCPEPDGACKVLSSGLTAPTPAAVEP